MNDPHGTNMSIQGLDSKYFLFLLNGNRMAGETTGNIDFSRLNTMNIERIELLNGGASTLYGSGAIGGVVNIITKDNKSLFDIRIKTKRYSEKEFVSQAGFLAALPAAESPAPFTRSIYLSNGDRL